LSAARAEAAERNGKGEAKTIKECGEVKAEATANGVGREGGELDG